MSTQPQQAEVRNAREFVVALTLLQPQQPLDTVAIHTNLPLFKCMEILEEPESQPLIEQFTRTVALREHFRAMDARREASNAMLHIIRTSPMSVQAGRYALALYHGTKPAARRAESSAAQAASQRQSTRQSQNQSPPQSPTQSTRNTQSPNTSPRGNFSSHTHSTQSSTNSTPQPIPAEPLHAQHAPQNDDTPRAPDHAPLDTQLRAELGAQVAAELAAELTPELAAEHDSLMARAASALANFEADLQEFDAPNEAPDETAPAPKLEADLTADLDADLAALTAEAAIAIANFKAAVQESNASREAARAAESAATANSTPTPTHHQRQPNPSRAQHPQEQPPPRPEIADAA